MADLNIIKIKFKLVPLFENLFMRLFFYFVITNKKLGEVYKNFT